MLLYKDTVKSILTTSIIFNNIDNKNDIVDRIINKKLLSSFEIKWINNYHKKVYRDLSKLIDKDDEELFLFLKRKTMTI